MKLNSVFHVVMVAVFALSSGVVSACGGSHRRSKPKVEKKFKKPVVKNKSSKKHKKN
jgi:hypothetical protein